MEYLLEDIVRLSRFSVDTIRYYQSMRLIPPPRHKGRNAIYTEEHLDRLRIVSRAAERGLPLRIVKEVFSKEEKLASDPALLAAVEKQLAKPCYTRAETAKLLGVSERLLQLVESRGLTDPLGEGDGALRYSDDDLRIARDALKLLQHGFPLTTISGPRCNMTVRCARPLLLRYRCFIDRCAVKSLAAVDAPRPNAQPKFFGSFFR